MAGAKFERRADGEPFGQRFSLFAECVVIGLLVAVACLPVVTWVAAFAAGAQSLDRYLDGRSAGTKVFLRHFRAVLPGAVVTAIAGLVVLLLLGLELAVVRAGLPGAPAVVAVIGTTAVALLVVQLRTAVTWTIGVPWWRQLRQAASRAVRDPGGSLLLAASMGVVVVATWQLPPLLVPALGCLVLGGVAIERRHAARERV